MCLAEAATHILLHVHFQVDAGETSCPHISVIKQEDNGLFSAAKAAKIQFCLNAVGPPDGCFRDVQGGWDEGPVWTSIIIGVKFEFQGVFPCLYLYGQDQASPGRPICVS